MIYTICYDWPSTSGNHTGMRYLYEYIQKKNPKLYKLYIFNSGNSFFDRGRKKKKIAAMKKKRREAEAMRIARERAEKRRRNWPY